MRMRGDREETCGSAANGTKRPGNLKGLARLPWRLPRLLNAWRYRVLVSCIDAVLPLSVLSASHFRVPRGAGSLPSLGASRLSRVACFGTHLTLQQRLLSLRVGDYHASANPGQPCFGPVVGSSSLFSWVELDMSQKLVAVQTAGSLQAFQFRIEGMPRVR